MNPPQSHRDTELQNVRVLTHRIIGCAIEVHKVLGPGLRSLCLCGKRIYRRL